MCPQIGVRFVVICLMVAFLSVRFMRSTWPFVQGWLGLVPIVTSPSDRPVLRHTDKPRGLGTLR